MARLKHIQTASDSHLIIHEQCSHFSKRSKLGGVLDFDGCHLCRSQNPPYERDAATFDLKSDCHQREFTGTITVTFYPNGSQENEAESWSREGEIYLPRKSVEGHSS